MRITDAEASAQLMVDVLEQGRVLVDRDARWPALRAGVASWRRLAPGSDEPLADVMPDLDHAERS